MSSSLRNRCLVWVLLSILFCGTAAPFAEPPNNRGHESGAVTQTAPGTDERAADEHLARGSALFNEGRADDAFKEFDEAARLKPHYAICFRTKTRHGKEEVTADWTHETKVLSRQAPQYPPLARKARIQGAVRLLATISKDGSVGKLRVMGGHPMLIKAALEAVQQWRYEKAKCHGKPAEIQTRIVVDFKLQN